MKDVIRIKMGMEEINNGDIKLHFGMGIQKDISSIMTEKEIEMIDDLSEKMTKVISDALERTMVKEEEEEESLSDLLERKIQDAYNRLSDEEKKDADNFRKKVDKCSSFEELFGLIKEII